MGHEHAFLRPRLNARYRFSQGTLGERGNGEKRRLRTYRSHTGTGVNPQAATRPRQALSLVLSTLLPATAAAGAVRSALGGKSAT